MAELYSRLSQFWEICVKFSGVFQFSGWMSSLLYSAIMFSFMISVQVSAEPANGYVGTTEQFVVNGESKQMVGYLYILHAVNNKTSLNVWNFNVIMDSSFSLCTV